LRKSRREIGSLRPRDFVDIREFVVITQAVL
jgi:hypothetical protein